MCVIGVSLRVRIGPPDELEAQIEAFVEDYDNQRYHESLNDVTVVCLNGNPNNTVRVRQACIAASLKACWRPRRPEGAASHTISGSNQPLGVASTACRSVDRKRSALLQ